MKLSPFQTLVIAAIAAVVLIVAGSLYIRHINGDDIADQIHESMKKEGNGHGGPPVSQDKIDAAKKGQTVRNP